MYKVMFWAAAALGLASHAAAATLPAGFTERTLTTSLTSATAMAVAPDGRIFVCEQGGALRVIKNGALLAQPFLTVAVNSTGERGLLGVELDPNFSSNGYLYIYYTAITPSIHNRVSRVRANGDVVAPGSETILLELNNLSSATNHNGGAMHFGADGKLYIAVGDNANGSNAQTVANMLGKILRINPDGSIPTDNPFYGQATGSNRSIWALGLRNPFTFAFENGTGRMFINDVGQNTWEEINAGQRGANYGWPTTEGTTTDSRFVSPVFAYGHGSNATTGCAITGGAFYPQLSRDFPQSYEGKYFFADYCSAWIRTFDPVTRTAAAFATNAGSVVDLRVGGADRLYYLNRTSLFEVEYTGSGAPQITTQPQSQTRTVGQSATFTVAASGTAPLTYQWQRNGSPISGATSATYTTPTLTAADTGAQFRAVVSNTAGSATSNTATLTVTANQAPTGTITSPATGAVYTAGQTISFAGSGTDPVGGTLPASAFTWRIDLHHDTHNHPAMQPVSGVKTGAYTIPTSGETSANVFYRIHLTVRDSAGLTHSTFRDIQPRKATITLASSPPGAQLTLDGQPVRAPFSFTGVVGIRRTIGAVSLQSIGGQQYSFASWSDAGAQTHAITTPAANTTYTATFRAQTGASVTLSTNPSWSKYSGDAYFVLRTSSPAPAGGWTVALSTGNPSLLSVPASVMVPAGNAVAYFTGVAGKVLSPQNVTLTASLAGSTNTATVTVLPAAVSYVYLGSTSVSGARTISGNFVSLNSAAAGGAVTLRSSHPSVLSLPSSVPIAAGAYRAYFSFTTTAVTSPVTVTISATAGGVTKTATVRVSP